MQKAFSFDKTSLKKIAKSLLMIIAATFLTFLANNLTQIIAAFNIPAEYQVYLSGLFMAIINAIREFIKGTPDVTSTNPSA